MTVSPGIDAALAVHRAGRLAEADALYARLLATDPVNAEAMRLRGVIACQESRFADAAGHLQAAIRLDAGNSGYYSNLGVALKGLGRTAEALEALERAAALDSPNTDIRYNIGCLLQELERRAEAMAAYQAVLAVAPDHVEALSNLGLLEVEAGHPDRALPHLRRAVSLKPEFLAARINLGLALHDLEQIGEAVACFTQALAADPDNAEIHYNLANALHAGQRYEDAIRHGRRAIELNPDHAEAYHNLGNGWRELGDPEKAVAEYRQALACKRDHGNAWRNLLSTLLYVPSIPAAERFAEHRRFSESLGVQPGPPPRIDNGTDRPLRIGYVSSDFRNHPVARNLEPVLAAHRREGLFVALYAQVRRPDEISDRFRSLANVWCSTVGLTDEEVGERIREDRIDILVHLAGRFDRNRPALAGLAAAPIQISFHDPATSGFTAMDYLIADRFLIPRSGSERFVERPLRLPSFYTHAPLEDAPDPGPLPAGGERPITFVSFNHPAKLNRQVLELWGKILRRVPDSRLWLKHRHRFSRPALQARIVADLGIAGIAPERLVFGGADVERHDHLELYCQADIALDPFPFTGSTTTFEALWMGVPVVTLAGPDMVARWSGSMLRALKLDELVASSAEAYVEAAVGLATDRKRLAAIRGSLRSRMAASPLCDGDRRARQIARLYRAVWRRRCAGLPTQTPEASG